MSNFDEITRSKEKKKKKIIASCWSTNEQRDKDSLNNIIYFIRSLATGVSESEGIYMYTRVYRFDSTRLEFIFRSPCVREKILGVRDRCI